MCELLLFDGGLNPQRPSRPQPTNSTTSSERTCQTRRPKTKTKSSTLFTLGDLGKNFASSIRDLLARFGKEFQSPRLRDDFRESCTALMSAS
jgi:hypothetical protein